MSVHHIDMDIVGRGDAPDVALQIREIGGENRGGDFNHGETASFLSEHFVVQRTAAPLGA